MKPLSAFITDTFMEVFVKIRAGYDIAFQCPYAVPMVLMLTTHPSRDGTFLAISRCVFLRAWKRGTSSIRTAIFAPGLLPRRTARSPQRLCCRGQRACRRGLPSSATVGCRFTAGEVLPFLLASRYCDTEKLSNLAWSLFGGIEAAGSGHKLSATTLTTASNSAIITHEAIVPPRRDTRSAAAFAGTSLILR